MDFEFETTRTCLANAFAAAGAELLGYLDIADTAVAAIPDSEPQKYAVAGTLNGILSMVGKMMGEDGVTALKLLPYYAIDRHGNGDVQKYFRVSDVERLLAATAPAGAQIPAVIREAVEAAFEDREGWRTKIAAAVRALGDAGAQNAEAIREDALEEAANALDLMNDSAGDRAAHEQRDMLCCETERMWTLISAAKAIRALQTGSANTQEGGA
jgi:hypothetical protein